MKPRSTVLEISTLSVQLPNGGFLFEDLNLVLNRGEVVVILGGSGAGKSTLARVLFEGKDLREQGFVFTQDSVSTSEALGLVPQRGAPFDHLDVAGNIELALRQDSKTAATPYAVLSWLKAVDLPKEMATPGWPVARLSGGQAQRLAVARTLASGRTVLFLDEPSVGLDPVGVVGLAQLVRQQSEAKKISFLVVTHDLQFAAHVADRILFLDPETRTLIPVLEGQWQGHISDPDSPSAPAARAALEKEVFRLLQQPKGTANGGRTAPNKVRAFGNWLKPIFGGITVPAAVATALPITFTRYSSDALKVLRRVLKNTVLRPLPFYAVVSVLLGYTVLYVIGRTMPAGLRAAKAVELIGGSYILALTPPICAFLFVATSGNVVNAWLGSMGLTKQIAALEALGIRRERYLWVPGYFGLVLAFLVIAAAFAGGMLLGGAWQSWQIGISNPWPLLVGDLWDPEPAREVLRTRAAWLVGIYSFGIAADVVYRGSARKSEADDVTRGMTGSVVACTLWVVSLELITALLIFAR